MNSHKNVVATFADKYGEVKQIHATRHGLKVARGKSTVVLKLNGAIAPLIGLNIRRERLAQKMTLEQLCRKAGLASATPKSRMYEIEKGSRGEGIRMGTLYAIAVALGVAPSYLLPSTEEALRDAGVLSKSEERLA